MKLILQSTKQSLQLCLLTVLLLFLATSLCSAEEHSHPVCGASCNDGANHVDVLWTPVTADNINTALNTSGNYYLAEDIQLNAMIDITTPNADVHLCLNGHVLKANGEWRPIRTEANRNVTLTICDCQPENTEGSLSSARTLTSPVDDSQIKIAGGLITGGNHSGYGGAIMLNDATLDLYGGTIGGNSTPAGGGAICLGVATFTMHAGTICCNTTVGGGSSDGGGVGFYIGDSNTFHLKGGTISHNKAERNGGGISLTLSNDNSSKFTMSGNATVEHNSAVYGGGIYCYTVEFTMEGGFIRNNQTKQNGGGIHLSNPKATLTGGEITGNESLLGADAKYYRSGAGIFYAGYNDSYLNISGAPLISGNTNSDHADDLFIQTPITIAGPLTNTVPIGISYLKVKEPKDGSPQNFTIDWSTHMGDQKPSDYFVSNDVGIYVLPRAEKDNTEGRLGVGYTITCNPTDLSHGQIHFSPENPLFAQEEVTLTILPDPGYRLADNTLKVYKTGNEATQIEVTDNTFIMPMHPVTLSATFELDSLKLGDIPATANSVLISQKAEDKTWWYEVKATEAETKALRQADSKIPFNGIITGTLAAGKALVMGATCQDEITFTDVIVPTFIIEEGAAVVLSSASTLTYTTAQNNGGSLIAKSGASITDGTDGTKTSAVTITAPTNGTLTVQVGTTPLTSGYQVTEGSQFTVTAIPSAGYELRTLTVNPVNGTALTPDATGAYTMPGEAITVSATFESTYVPPVPTPTYYTVTLPSVIGAVTNPAAGRHEVERWDNFLFALTLDADYNQSVPQVTVNGLTLTPRKSDGKYILENIQENKTVSITGIVKNIPTDNAKIESANRIYASNGILYIQTPQPVEAYIVSLGGQLLRTLHLPAGETKVGGLSQGLYIVRLSNGTTEKVKL